tara:strand:- start:9862 stop:10125 length:264 start_codon:yes stop_codon:yes gene_type:complete
MIDIMVHTTNNRGHTPEEIASFCADKLMHVADTAPPIVRDQAVAFKEQMKNVISDHVKQGILSDRTTVYNVLNEAGHPELAELIRRM